jgi:hypothetical protein
VTVLLKEVRVTNITEGGERRAERMPYHVMVMREYMFHNQNRGDKQNQLKSKDPKRVDKEPVTSIKPSANPAITVDMAAVGEDDEQS